MDEKFIEVDGNKFVDDGTGSAKLDDKGQPIPFIEGKGQTVPIGRFEEVYGKMKDLEQEISSLKFQGKEKGGLSAEQEKELAAKTYLKNLLKETLEEEKKGQAEQEIKEQKEFEQEVADILIVNSDVKKKDFLDFIDKNSEEFGIESVNGAMKLYRHLETVKKSAAEEERKKPGMPAHEGGAARIEPKAEDKDKSFSEITNEIHKELRK
jgi:hypothetical protein